MSSQFDYPNGIPSQSPGLRRNDATLGLQTRQMTNPNGVDEAWLGFRNFKITRYDRAQGKRKMKEQRKRGL